MLDGCRISDSYVSGRQVFGQSHRRHQTVFSFAFPLRTDRPERTGRQRPSSRIVSTTRTVGFGLSGIDKVLGQETQRVVVRTQILSENYQVLKMLDLLWTRTQDDSCHFGFGGFSAEIVYFLLVICIKQVWARIGFTFGFANGLGIGSKFKWSEREYGFREAGRSLRFLRRDFFC